STVVSLVTRSLPLPVLTSSANSLRLAPYLIDNLFDRIEHNLRLFALNKVAAVLDLYVFAAWHLSDPLVMLLRPNRSYCGGHGVVLRCGEENNGNAGRDFGGARLLIGGVHFRGLIAHALGSLGNLFVKSCPLSFLMRSSPVIEGLL